MPRRSYPSPVFARLRRAALAKGLTMKPACPSCKAERDPKAFTKLGICTTCQAEYDASEAARLHDRIDDLEHQLDQLAEAEPGTEVQERVREAERARIEGKLFDAHFSLEPEERAAAFGDAHV